MSEHLKAGIYQITNIQNGLFYIGSSIDLLKRKREHFSSLQRGDHKNRYLQRAYTKYGREAFSFQILIYCDVDKLLFYEQAFIEGICPEYNICKQAQNALGVIRTKEARENMSAAQKRRFEKEEEIRALSEAHKGYSPNEYTRMKVSQALLGHVVTDETRQKITSKLIGIPKTEEAKQNMRIGNIGRKGHPISEEARRKISETRKIRYGRQTNCG